MLFLMLFGGSACALTPFEYLGAKGYDGGEIGYILIDGQIDSARKTEIDTRHKLEMLGFSGAELETKMHSYFPPKRNIVGAASMRSGPLNAAEREVLPYVVEASRTWLIRNAWIYAVIRTESNFDHQAISTRGAGGTMQLMPRTARDVGVRDRFDQRENIMGGTRYLRMMFDRFGDWDLALAAYVAGPETVELAGRRIPNSPEVHAYLRNVRRFYEHYSKLVS